MYLNCTLTRDQCPQKKVLSKIFDIHQSKVHIYFINFAFLDQTLNKFTFCSLHAQGLK